MRAYTYKGHSGILESQTIDSHPVFGDRFVEVWTGTPEFCDSLYHAWREQGAEVSIVRAGLPYRVTITHTSIPELLAPPTIEWVHTTELVDRSLWSLPAVQAEAATFLGEAPPTSSMKYKQAIEKLIEQGDPYSVDDPTVRDFVDIFPPAIYPYASMMFLELSRGNEDYQESVEVIQRVRVASWQYPFARAKLSSRLVYSTAQVGVPSDIVSSFWFPPEVPQSIVGWRLRGQHYTLESTRRVETIEFVLAAWSTLPYEAAGGGFI